MTNKICDGCETVAHCLKKRCVPKTTKKDEAISAERALKLALEALEYPGNVWHMDCPRNVAITAIREALASGASEESSVTEQPVHSEAYWQKKISIAYAEGWLKGQGRVKQQPAKRTWVGLTDEERMDVLLALNWDKQLTHMNTAKSIEAKLKEKNSDQ